MGRGAWAGLVTSANVVLYMLPWLLLSYCVSMLKHRAVFAAVFAVVLSSSRQAPLLLVLPASSQPADRGNSQRAQPRGHSSRQRRRSPALLVVVLVLVAVRAL